MCCPVMACVSCLLMIPCVHLTVGIWKSSFVLRQEPQPREAFVTHLIISQTTFTPYVMNLDCHLLHLRHFSVSHSKFPGNLGQKATLTGKKVSSIKQASILLNSGP